MKKQKLQIKKVAANQRRAFCLRRSRRLRCRPPYNPGVGGRLRLLAIGLPCPDVACSVPRSQLFPPLLPPLLTAELTAYPSACKALTVKTRIPVWLITHSTRSMYVNVQSAHNQKSDSRMARHAQRSSYPRVAHHSRHSQHVLQHAQPNSLHIHQHAHVPSACSNC